MLAHARGTSRRMKMLGIDFGERRIGLALSDPDGRYALPWRSLDRTSDRAAVAAIRELVRQEGVELLVVGDPRRPTDGASTEASRRAHAFGERLARACSLPVEWVDEALTSWQAEERLRDAGVPPKRRAARLDAVAAQILLEAAISRRSAT